MLTQRKFRSEFKLVRLITTSPRLSKSHYDVLEVTPKSTQSEIKSSYYKLSKIYHPDRSNDEASAKKFRALTEAYEVLGNIKLKKMYDKGLLVGRENTSRMDYKPEPEPTDPTLKFFKSRMSSHMTRTIDGKTPIYNFDSWAQNHYEDLFRKAQYEKEILKKKKDNQTATSQNTNQEALLYLMCILGGMFILMVVNGRAEYDRDDILQKKNAKKLDSLSKTD